MKKPAREPAGRDELNAAQEQLKAINQQLEESNRQLKVAEDALHRSKEQYKTMFEGTINAIAVYEAVDDGNDFILRNFNPSAERIERVKKEDLLGRSVLEALPSVKEFGLFAGAWALGDSLPKTVVGAIKEADAVIILGSDMDLVFSESLKACRPAKASSNAIGSSSTFTRHAIGRAEPPAACSADAQRSRQVPG